VEQTLEEGVQPQSCILKTVQEDDADIDPLKKKHVTTETNAMYSFDNRDGVAWTTFDSKWPALSECEASLLASLSASSPGANGSASTKKKSPVPTTPDIVSPELDDLKGGTDNFALNQGFLALRENPSSARTL